LAGEGRKNKRKKKKRNPWFDAFDDIEKAEKTVKRGRPYMFKGNIRRTNMRYPYIRIIKSRRPYRRSPFAKEPEPLVDVLENGEIITVVAQLPGFKREEINVHVKGSRLIISASTMDKRYYKNLKLPAEVETKPIYNSYKNGVLELRFRKLVEKKVIVNEG